MFEKLAKILKIVKFAANSTLKDGTELYIDGDLTEGTKVYVITEDGNLPLPDGNYEFENGTIITIEEGIIINVEEPSEEEVTDEPEVEAQEDEISPETSNVSDKITELENVIQSIIERLSKLEGSNSELSKNNTNLKKENVEFDKQIKEFKTLLEKTSGADPIKKNVVETTNFSNPRIQALKNFRK